jgi:hypothetical protein
MPDDDVRLNHTVARPAFQAKTRPCAACGKPFDGQGTTCAACLNAKYYAEALEKQTAFFKENPHAPALVAKRMPPRKQHLALAGHPSVAWCGELLHPSGSARWQSIYPGQKFQNNTCAACLEIYARVTGRKVIVDSWREGV